MAIPIAAILAAAQLIQGGVQKVTDRRNAMRARYKADQDNYKDVLLRAAERRGADTTAGRQLLRQGDMDYQDALTQRGITNRPIDYGSIGGLIGGVGGAIGGKAAPTAPTTQAPPMSIGAPEDFQPAEGYVSQSRIQAPIIISGPDRGVRRNPDDEDWFGNYA
jgi:hypothetical protein